MGEDVQGKRGHAVAHKHPEAQVASDFDRGLHGDEIAQMKHIGASVVEPVICNEAQSSARTAGTNVSGPTQTHQSQAAGQRTGSLLQPGWT